MSPTPAPRRRTNQRAVPPSTPTASRPRGWARRGGRCSPTTPRARRGRTGCPGRRSGADRSRAGAISPRARCPRWPRPLRAPGPERDARRAGRRRGATRIRRRRRPWGSRWRPGRGAARCRRSRIRRSRRHLRPPRTRRPEDRWGARHRWPVRSRRRAGRRSRRRRLQRRPHRPAGPRRRRARRASPTCRRRRARAGGRSDRPCDYRAGSGEGASRQERHWSCARIRASRGDVAQPEEHRVRIAGVRGSSPLISTTRPVGIADGVRDSRGRSLDAQRGPLRRR
jgi:hypothetical protein